jgi:hypothetical protein
VNLLPGLARFRRARVAPLRRVVYTCLFGYSERFNDFHYPAGDIDFVCFTDDRDLASSFWQMRLVPRGLLDPVRRAKQVKALPHRFLPDHDVSLYIDNTVRLKLPPHEIFERCLTSGQSPLICFRHPWRDCVYDEAEAVIAAAYDDPDRVRRQMAFYRAQNYPAHHGLAKSTMLLRRHGDPHLQRVMQGWHEQVLQHSHRDQLALNPVMWAEQFEPDYLTGDFLQTDMLDWPVVPDGLRIPRDFDDARYRALNPDVTGDGRRHYLLHGAAAGRRYK